jgi:hypothetical protein
MPIKLSPPDVSPDGGGLGGLICAAVVSQAFCDLLLGDPATALRIGYNGKPFLLTTEERELTLSIQATSLADLAAQLTENRDNQALRESRTETHEVSHREFVENRGK